MNWKWIAHICRCLGILGCRSRAHAGLFENNWVVLLEMCAVCNNFGSFGLWQDTWGRKDLIPSFQQASAMWGLFHAVTRELFFLFSFFSSILHTSLHMVLRYTCSMHTFLICFMYFRDFEETLICGPKQWLLEILPRAILVQDLT